MRCDRLGLVTSRRGDAPGVLKGQLQVRGSREDDFGSLLHGASLVAGAVRAAYRLNAFCSQAHEFCRCLEGLAKFVKILNCLVRE
jgi:hypothetical protein